MNSINPVWIAVGISLVTTIVTAIVAYQASLRGTAVALARFEERQNFQGDDLRRMRNEQDAHSDLLSDHGERIAVLEHAIDMRPPPLDYPRRA